MAHRGQRLLPHKVAHYHGIDNIVKLLEDIAQHDGQGKQQQ